MQDQVIRIATRKSALALWQAEDVKAKLEQAHPGLEVELHGLKSKGDKILDVPLAKVGGKGLFVKELEESMLRGETDIAVHSMKDVPMEFPEGLGLAVILDRESPYDAFVSNDYDSLDDMPEGSVVGTSSLRRQAQILAQYPHLKIEFLRGNVNTRLAKLDDGQYDAIILAAAGLIRLGFGARIRNKLSDTVSLPAIGQGAVGIECRTDDDRLLELLKPLAHEDTTTRVMAERAFNNRLNGGCQVPIAGYAVLEGDDIWLRGLVGEPDGSKMIRGEIRGAQDEAEQLGVKLAEDLLKQGAGDILTRLGLNPD